MEVQFLTQEFAQHCELYANPIVIGILVSILSILGGGHIWDLNKLSISFLGPKSSGKTLLFKWLKGEAKEYIKNPKGNGPCDPYEAFDAVGTKNSITIKKGFEINGDITSLKFYKEYMQGKDIVFFTFNAYLYCNEENYKDDVNLRLDLIYDLKNEHNVKTVVLLATFKDKFEQSEYDNIQSKIYERIGFKNGNPNVKEDYAELFGQNYDIINLTDENEVAKMLDKYLKRKKFIGLF